MQITVEISLYPLHTNYGTTVLDFLADLRTHDGITIRTNHMSTQVSGKYEVVMSALHASIRRTLSQDQSAALVIKIFNEELDLDWINLP